MPTKNIYEEKIIPKVEMCILGMAIAFSFFQFLLLPVLVLIVAMYAFREFNIKMTSDAVIVKYGGKRTIPWENINDCYLDKSSIIRYGGFGYRMGRVKGKWRDVFNVLGYPRVVLSLKEGKFFKEAVFSIKNPEEVMKIINERIGGVK